MDLIEGGLGGGGETPDLHWRKKKQKKPSNTRLRFRLLFD